MTYLVLQLHMNNELNIKGKQGWLTKHNMQEDLDIFVKTKAS